MFFFLKVFVSNFHNYYRLFFVIFFWHVVTNDGDVVNVVDLVVLGRHGGVVDVSTHNVLLLIITL
jgi:hypothetical protein